MERAEMSLRKLAAQAHGETLTRLMTAWQERQADELPSAQELGRAINAATRQAWAQAVSAQAKTPAATALLRLEMAAEVPTPADKLSERRMLQLQLLTRRHAAAPNETENRAHQMVTLVSVSRSTSEKPCSRSAAETT